MKFFDDLVVGFATRVIRGALAVGTVFVYVQAAGLFLLLAGAVVLAVYYAGRLALGI
ncbi:hypothetical protein [Mesorhizobium sp. J428]|uniref:hypothetical protein n=1 Tax=Mesorhizobium sp. J428 TaxID=2898440 RepID=UPI0021513110|nr:hypothetical protein [Mesorhizobium sp. J428]MCR5860123.1 hypothetical protein [Mesorhizobium sp. J428]MCR5860153.1 hypothetical protein [Mesorhizobium sp. J428]MCR5860188.1 hypothetical protein [Mesorhizobium sp. J428]MCR5860217.1 hypothetical protein [Mesorhizobium sp. J428]